MTNLTVKETRLLLRKLGACGLARRWAKGKTLGRCWDTCDRYNWLMWLVAKLTPTIGTQQQYRAIARDEMAAWRKTERVVTDCRSTRAQIDRAWDRHDKAYVRAIRKHVKKADVLRAAKALLREIS